MTIADKRSYIKIETLLSKTCTDIHDSLNGVKLMAYVLEEDRPATSKERSRITGAKTAQENAQKPTSVSRGWATHPP